MGIPCSSFNKNKEINLSKECQFKEYICKIKKDETEVFGFFCNFRYSNQNIFIPTIITRKDSFDENINFDGNYFIKINNNNDWSLINLKKIYIFDKYNIVILLISEGINNINNISFLEIPNYDYMENMNHYSDVGQYLLFYLEKRKIKFLTCLINNVDENDYTFDYICNGSKNVFKYALILKTNKKELIGIHMKKGSNKGILIKGIIKEMQNYQINNKIDNSLNKICIIDNKALSQFKEKGRKDQNNNLKQNNNESHMDNEIDSLEIEEKLYLNNLKTIQIEKNDFDNLSKKSSFKNNKYNKLNNDNSIPNVINKGGIDKKNQVYFEKIQNDNSEKKIDSINNLDSKKNNSNKSNNNDINKLIYEEQEKKSNLKDLKNEIVDNKTFEENSDLKKQLDRKNNQNRYEKNDYCNIDNNRKISKEISLYFVFNNGKELYLDVEDSCTFDQVIEQLNEKYLWLKLIKIKEYRINNERICKNKTAKENKLVNNSIIHIIECS